MLVSYGINEDWGNVAARAGRSECRDMGVETTGFICNDYGNGTDRQVSAELMVVLSR